ncbi:MAG: sulfatase [Opitutaceae bacterium]|nr:sulfatase [Opitutaceae bacterium]
MLSLNQLARYPIAFLMQAKVLFGTITALFLAQASFGERHGSQYNILYVTIDDLNDWVGCMNSHPQVKTPNIDRLAERGLLFTNAHCVVPACSGSRAANWTGLSPINNGVYGNGQRIEKTMPKATMLTHDLESQGYYTMGTGKLFHGRNQNYFDEYGPDYDKWMPILPDERTISKESLADNDPYVRHEIPRLGITMPLNRMPRDRNRGSRTIDSFDWGVIDRPDEEWTDTQSAEWVVEKLGQSYDQPFFLAIGFYRPHQPLWVPKRFHEMYPPESVILPHTLKEDLEDVSEIAQSFGRYALTSGAHDTVVEYGQWRNAVSAYLASITYIDHELGKVIDALDASKHADNTLIVLWSDHGWQLGEKEHWGKFTTWERSTKVPLIAVPPLTKQPSGFKPGRECHHPVSLLDLYPTVMDALDLDIRDDLDGNSLLPLIANPESRWPHLAITHVGRGTQTIRHSRWRYTQYFDGSEELYDHGRDPREWNNLIEDPEYANIAQWLSNELPRDPNYKHFVRYGDYKAVVPSDSSPMMLFGPKVEMLAESKDVSKNHPDIVLRIQNHLKTHPNSPKRFILK